ncbi:MAG: type II secretion system protein N [Lautropia sp.]|nr:MAG: type II secretion system protein N [Lautropia sp.]RKW39798.1 MAG: type II secretion system protein N [Lautropia sp.]
MRPCARRAPASSTCRSPANPREYSVAVWPWRWHAVANDSRRSKSVKPAWFGPWSKGRIALWTVLSLLVALVTALVLAPASMADWGLKVATHGRVRLADASGSIWHGQGKVVLVDVAALAARERDKPDAVLPLPGVLVPGTIRWDIQVLPLLIGRVQVLARHDSMAQPVEISGTFARPRFSAGSIRLPNVSLSRLGSPWSTVQPTASLALSWEPFEIVNGKANGVASIELRDVASALTPVRPLGAYRLDIDGRQADTMLNMSSIEGPLRLSGEGVFNPSHGLRFTAWAEVDESERLKLAPLVRLLGRQEGTRTMIKIGA